MVYPESCPICSEPLRSWESKMCESCRQTLCELRKPLCRLCACELPPFSNLRMCQNCRRTKHYVNQTWSLYAYNDSMKKLFHLIKFKRKRTLLHIFEQEIKRFAEETSLPSFDCLIPIPLDWKKKWERGFNQSNILASFLKSFLNCPIQEWLKKRKATPAQSLLAKRDRERNLLNSFRVAHSNRLDGKNVLLVDDIYTTGTTVNECARILKGNGACTVSVFTVARAGSNWN